MRSSMAKRAARSRSLSSFSLSFKAIRLLRFLLAMAASWALCFSTSAISLITLGMTVSLRRA